MKRDKQLILVVDDTEGTRYAVARTLRAEGYDIIEAATGREALMLATEKRPDLVTLDIHLPDIIGFEVCRIIKANPGTAHIPVLQVSASYITSKDKIHGLEGGADSYLTHPFEPSVLAATVKALLRGSHLLDDLRLSEDRFKVALKYAPITIYTADRDLRFKWIYNIPFGLTANDFIGRSCAEIFDAHEVKNLVKVKLDVLNSGFGTRITSPITFNGVIHWFDMTIEPLTEVDGDITGVTVACIDVTHRIESEKAQKQAFETAESANQAKSRFLANMSHEIRTPLGIIQGFADLAATSASDKERAEYLAIIKKNANNLTYIIGDILDLAKIEAGKVDLELVRFSPIELVTDVVSALSLTAQDKNLSLKASFSADFPQFVSSDVTRIRQVLTNLVNNSLKFTMVGGIEIRGKVLAADAELKTAELEFEVIDSGIGMTPAQQSKIFEAFVQADTSTTRKFGGTGLGLHLSRMLAEALGGQLILRASAPSQGSTFAFSFKVSAGGEDLSTKVIEFADNTQRLKGLRVLLVEDSPENQVLFSILLKRLGAEVVVASDGADAGVKAFASSFDIVLMDMQMPIKDGYDATKSLRAMGFKSPIIALSAHAMKEDKDRALAAGCDDYVTKPVDQADLLKAILRYTHTAEPS